MFKSNRITIFILISILFITSIITVLILIKNKKYPDLKNNNFETEKISSPNSSPSNTQPKNNFIEPSLTDDKIIIQTENGDVKINNFYKDNPKEFSLNGKIVQVLIDSNSDFSTSFFPEDQSFQITLSNPALEATRTNAENFFMKKLGIDETQACELKVAIKTIYSVNKEVAGKDYGISFCPNGLEFPE